MMKFLFDQNISYRITKQLPDQFKVNSLFGFPPKRVWIRAGNVKTLEIMTIILQNIEEIVGFLENKDYGFFELIDFRDGFILFINSGTIQSMVAWHTNHLQKLTLT